MWVATLRLDDDKLDVGTATATWNAGEVDEFTYSKRVKVTVAEGRAFATEAVAAKRAVLARIARETPLAATLTTFLTDAEAIS